MYNFRRAAVFLPFLLGFSACVVETISKNRPRKGPVPEVGFIDNGGGEVRYSLQGFGFIVAGRRRMAFRRMRALCKGLVPRVVDEFSREDADVPYSTDDLQANLQKGVEHYNVASFHHMIFECAPREAAPAAPK